MRSIALKLPEELLDESGRFADRLRISRAEYDTVVEALRETGLENGWTQEYRMETSDDLVGWKMEASNAIDMEKKA